MISFPNCKINLGLYIVAKRNDGFHDLETVFYPLDVKDGLEVIPGQKTDGTDIHFTVSGLEVAADETNICVRAFRMLKTDFPDLPAPQMHLHKNIPLGAGLGGGSADGAFALMLINDKFNLGLQQKQLITYALKLGSDCPFFIVNKPVFASGRGELMEPVEVNLSGFQILLVNPRIHINTGWAFGQITPASGRTSLKNVIKLPLTEWKKELINDFEESVFRHYPEIAEIKGKMYAAGALYSSMSGSGSSVYGIFEKAATLPAFQADYFVKVV